jgi:hypothetical protein
MNFLTLFCGCGHPGDNVIHFFYQDITQWELLHNEDGFATHITNIFFKSTCFIVHQVHSSSWLFICKGELKGRKTIEKYVKVKHNLEKILKSSITYHSLKVVCISPNYPETFHMDALNNI